MAGERDLFANFERMRREIDELFGDVFERSGLTSTRGFSPRVDVYYTGQPPTAVVTVDLAGVETDSVSLEIHGRQLTIAGHRRAQESEGRLYQQIEIPHGPFRRVVEMGADVEADAARATYEDGILRVEIPLVEQRGRGRQVPINSRAESDDPRGGELPE
jgi:HSP20 family protein